MVKTLVYCIVGWVDQGSVKGSVGFASLLVCLGLGLDWIDDVLDDDDGL